MRFWHYFRLLRAHRVFVMSIVFSASALAVVLMYVYPGYPAASYRSVARLLVTPPGYESTQLSAEPRPWNYGFNHDEVFTTTVAEMLKSESVLDLAERDLPEGERRTLSRSLEIEPVKAPKQGTELLTHVIEVRSRAGTPEAAQRNTNALLDALTTFHAETARRQAQDQRTLIADEVEASRARLAEARAELQMYKEGNGFIDLERNAATLTDDYLALHRQLIASQSGLSKMTPDKESATKRAMGETLDLIRELPAKEARLAELVIDAEVAGDSYRLLNTKLLEADVTETINIAAGRIDVMDSASLPELPVSYVEPRGSLDFIPAFDYRKAIVLFATLVLSGVFGSSWVIVSDRLDDRIRRGSDAVRATGLALLGEIPVADSRVLASGGTVGGGAYRQCYNTAAARVVSYLAGGGKPVVAIVGAKPGEGRTTVVAELGRALAEAGVRVAIVDGDQRSRGLSRRFNVGTMRGLTDVVAGAVPTSEILVSTDCEGLFIVPAGTEAGAPISSVSSADFGEHMRWLGAGVEIVLVDTPPAMAFADATFAIRSADAAVFVMRAGSTPGRKVHESVLEQMRLVNDQFLGIVLVGVELEDSESVYQFSRYGGSLEDVADAGGRVRAPTDQPSKETAD